MLQQFLKNTLKLQFQLEAINYDAPNFVHADLDAETFFQMENQRGESITGLMIKSMLQEMMDPGNDDDPTGGVGPLLLALSSPDKARGLKMMLGEQFGRMDDMLAGMEGPDGSVLLTERNKACMKVLADCLAKGDKKIGIFYGAGHLRGMEKIMITQMGFQQIGDPKWRIAWDMSGPATTQPATESQPTTVKRGACSAFDSNQPQSTQRHRAHREKREELAHLTHRSRLHWGVQRAT